MVRNGSRVGGTQKWRCPIKHSQYHVANKAKRNYRVKITDRRLRMGKRRQLIQRLEESLLDQED